jgi:hypothetical protein
MSRTRNRSGAALMLLTFGLAPWVDQGVWMLSRRELHRLGQSQLGAIGAVLLTSLGVGAVAAVTALVIGTVAARRSRREATAAAAGDGGPRRPLPDARVSTTVARSAALIAVVGLWGPFGVAFLDPLLSRRDSILYPDPWQSWCIAVITVAAALAGALTLIRGRRQRAI